jgi:hypothetical protein
MKIHPMGAELFHADGRTDRQTDMTKLTVAFRNFVTVPKKGLVKLPRCVCVPHFKFCLKYFHEIRYECCDTGDHPNPGIYNVLESDITT